MAPRPPNRRKREKSSRREVRRGRAHAAASAWTVSWTARDGKTHSTYHATLEEAVAFASNKSGYVSRQWSVLSVWNPRRLREWHRGTK